MSSCARRRDRLIVLAWALASTPAAAVTLFPAGAESKSTGMESALKARGAPAVLYNPANLAAPDDTRPAPTPYAEVGLINVNYSYEHPQFDPVSVVVTSPTATIGYAQPIGERLSFGAVLFPSASGKTEVPGLPRKVGDAMVAVIAESEDEVVDLGLGIGYRVLPGLSVGLSLVHTREEHTVTAELPDSINPLVDMSYHNTFNRPVVGVSLAPVPPLAVALAYRPAQVKTYRGSSRMSVDEASTDPKVKGYEPATLSLGVEARLGALVLGAEGQRQAWENGRTEIKNGIDQDMPDADLKDVVQTSISAGYAPSERARLTAAYTRLPTPWGDGNDTGELDDHVFGVDFGQLNGIDLAVYSLGGHAQVLGAEATLSVYHARGEREVTGQGDNLGFYSLWVTSVSGGLRKPF